MNEGSKPVYIANVVSVVIPFEDMDGIDTTPRPTPSLRVLFTPASQVYSLPRITKNFECLMEILVKRYKERCSGRG